MTTQDNLTQYGEGVLFSANTSPGPIDDGEREDRYGVVENELYDDSNPTEITFPNSWTVPATDPTLAPDALADNPGLFMGRTNQESLRKLSDVSTGFTCGTRTAPVGSATALLGRNVHRKRVLIIINVNNNNNVFLSADPSGSNGVGSSSAIIGSSVPPFWLETTGPIYISATAANQQISYVEESYA